MNKSFYVDDLLASYESEDEAINNVKDVRSALLDASFNLTSLVSNSATVLKSMCTSNNILKPEAIIKMPGDDSDTRALGMIWNTCDGTLK